MSEKKLAKRVVAGVPEKKERGRLGVGGSVATEWNTMLANQTVNTLTVGDDDETQRRQYHAAALGLIGISPRDELEGMMAAQLIAAYNATMECYRRAAVPDQTFEGRRENLNQANKLSRTYSMLLEAFNRHRGKGQQKMTVEHVHVHAGGQAVVGMVEAPGGGDRAKSEERPHGKHVAMHRSRRCGARTRRRTVCQSPAMPNGRCRIHGGKSPGAAVGNSNARKHGRYSGEAIAERRSITALIRTMKSLAGQGERQD